MMQPYSHDQPEAAAQLRQMIRGYRATQMIYTAVILGIPDYLSDGPRASTELAESLELNTGALRRVMRGLVNLGILHEQSDGAFALTPLGALLRRDGPGEFRLSALLAGKLRYPIWLELLHTLRTGEPIFEKYYGASLFRHLARDAEMGETFNELMIAFTEEGVQGLLDSYDFSGFGTIVDVGGGHGALLASILRQNRGLHGVLFDESHVLAGAHSVLEAAPVSERCELVPGNFFEDVPRGGDAYLLKWIIHDWDDASAIRILKNCHAAMDANAVLLVIEAILPEHLTAFSPEVEWDMHMLTELHGRERTGEEFRDLLREAGFQLQRIVPTPYWRMNVIEGKGA